MKLAIFGATGNTGLATVANALASGHTVTILVRNAAKLAEIEPEWDKQAVAVVEGDVLDMDAVRRAVAGQDAVIVTLGTRNDLRATTVLSDGTRNIVTAMKEAGVRRISACISLFLFWEPDKIPLVFADLHADHVRMMDVLRQSDSDWIATCPPHIQDEPAHDKYDTAIGKGVGHTISKYDLADFLVKCLSKDELVHKAVGIGYSTDE